MVGCDRGSGDEARESGARAAGAARGAKQARVLVHGKHQAVNFEHHLLGIDVGRYRDRINALAASVCVVKFGVYGPMLEVLGDRSYMPEHLRIRGGT